MKGNTVEWINTLGAFCGVRDVPTLTKDVLEQKYGFRQADVMVLFGGSILCGGNVLAEAMKNQAAKKYVIVGGRRTYDRGSTAGDGPGGSRDPNRWAAGGGDFPGLFGIPIWKKG